MPAVPPAVFQQEQLTKLKSKSEHQMVFEDKIINKTIEPLLFNVQCAASAMKAKQNKMSHRAARRRARGSDARQNNLLTITNDTLLEMNVALASLPQDFTLLEDMVDISPDVNPNVMSMQLADSIKNKPSDIKKHFPSDKDPIFQLDDGNNNKDTYSQAKISGKVVATVDLSKVLCNLNIMNQSSDYFGRNKYYL